ncbi:hypothetical protein BDQ17DRAFT_132292 [Cyathus striatus]|nr:hypothetical protein BDQ17DRAFT_132292 [Cyathus striatus]
MCVRLSLSLSIVLLANAGDSHRGSALCIKTQLRTNSHRRPREARPLNLSPASLTSCLKSSDQTTPNEKANPGRCAFLKSMCRGPQSGVSCSYTRTGAEKAEKAR